MYYSLVIINDKTGLFIYRYFSENLSKKFGTQVNDLWDTFGTDFTYPGNLPSYMEEYFEEQQLEGKSQDIISSKIKCLPLPGKSLARTIHILIESKVVFDGECLFFYKKFLNFFF